MSRLIMLIMEKDEDILKEVLKRFDIKEMREYDLSAEKILQIGNMTINSSSRTVTFMENRVDLRKIEFDILYYLSQRKGQYIKYREIYKSVWNKTPDDHFVEKIHQHVSAIRTAFNKISDERTFRIRVLRGVGYGMIKEQIKN